jgi:hypothetical protein
VGVTAQWLIPAVAPVLNVRDTACWIVAEICSVGETVLELVDCVPAKAAADVIIATARITKLLFINLGLLKAT